MQHNPNRWLNVYVLVEYLKNPQSSFEELSHAVAQKQVIATPKAIARFFNKHDLKTGERIIKSIGIGTFKAHYTILHCKPQIPYNIFISY